MSKAVKWISVILFLILLSLVGAYFAQRMPYLRARSAMPHGEPLRLTVQADGALRLTWEPSSTADDYELYVLGHDPDEQGEQPCLFSAVCTQPSCMLPASLPEDEPLDIRIGARRHYTSLGESHIRRGDDPIAVVCYLNRPEIMDLRATVDDAQSRAYLSWTGWRGDSFRLFLQNADGSRTLLRVLEHVGAQIEFGDGGELPIPAFGETVTFAVDCFRETDGLVFYGAAAQTVSVGHEDFLGRTLTPQVVETGDNRFTLSWNETKGARYEVREIDPNTGLSHLCASIGAGGELAYRTGKLDPFATYSFEIAAVGGETFSGSDYAAYPVRVELRTHQSPVYAAVWALIDTPIYAAPDGQVRIGTMTTSRAWCVLAEEGEYFQIGTPQLTGYVKSSRCMIDLPDYIGDLCSYDITNSYSSLYMVHEFGIPEVTDTVVAGYEGVALPERRALVPLLYPVANRLISAALAMRDDGYRIKIYDSFRPNRATRSIYDLTARIMADPIPDETFTGKRLNDLPERTEEDEPLTYAQVMTSGGFGLGDFLASGGSMHNLGVAIDMTMERASDRTELTMQTSMHDLSWYSSVYRNNANANLLRQYMTGVGFGGLVSEWWHFQDNEAVSAYGPANRWTGVTPEGWRRDDDGWRYRQADGTYCIATERTIDGAACRFDGNGYLIE